MLMGKHEKLHLQLRKVCVASHRHLTKGILLAPMLCTREPRHSPPSHKFKRNVCKTNDTLFPLSVYATFISSFSSYFIVLSDPRLLQIFNQNIPRLSPSFAFPLLPLHSVHSQVSTQYSGQDSQLQLYLV